MTRETKIGLLVGLAFIVVFAMLLSHSSPAPLPGDPLQLAKAAQESARKEASSRADVHPVIPDPVTTDGSTSIQSPAPVSLDIPSPSTESVSALPTPAVLDLPSPSTVADNTALRTAEFHPDAPSPNLLQVTRVAPPVPPQPVAKPEPTQRESKPSETTPPPAEPVKAVPSPRPALPKEYIVRKGDKLGRIVESLYGTASARVIDFFVKANKERIKNKDMVVEGQKLSVPDLPADMFEPVQRLNLAHADVVKASALDAAINDSPRRAPVDVKQSSTDKPADPGAAKPAKEIRANEPPAKETARVYEVQAKDTLTSIAREQLGSESSWREIQKLNKGIDPTKIRPGTKIKLPAKRSATGGAEASTAERTL